MENNITDAITSIAAIAAVVIAAIAIYLTNKSIKENNKNHEKQAFENKIFSLIDIHNDALSKFRQINILSNENIYFYGHAAISFWLDGFKKSGLTGFYNSDEKNSDEAIQCRNVDSDICKANFDIKAMHDSFCFIDNIIVILSLINNEEKLTEEKEYFYLELLHAQITKEELVVIFYYIHSHKKDKKPLFEKYAFFENIDLRLLLNWQEEINIYKREAYGLYSYLCEQS